MSLYWGLAFTILISSCRLVRLCLVIERLKNSGSNRHKKDQSVHSMLTIAIALLCSHLVSVLV